jgi:cytochrome P450
VNQRAPPIPLPINLSLPEVGNQGGDAGMARLGGTGEQPEHIDRASRRVSLDATDPRFFQNPYAAFDRIRAVAPIFFWEELGMWCLTEYEAVNNVFRDRRFGREILHVATREEVGLAEPPEHVRPFYDIDNLSMIAREPPVHTRLRTLVNRAFVSRQIEKLRPRVAELAHGLIDGLGETRTIDLITAYCTPIPVTVIAELLGVPAEEGVRLVDWSHRMVAMYTPARNRAIEDSAVRATEEFVAFLKVYVRERRKNPRDDLISHLIAAEAAGQKLSEDELIAGTIQLLNAGHEATVHSIGNAVKAILESDESPAALFSSDDSTAALCEEALRFDPPLHFFDRYALEPVEVEGVRLKKGEKIGLLLAAANRDPARWEEPALFRPSRPVLPNISFGAGIHFCIGAPLARLEMQVALPILFQRLPKLRLASTPLYRNAWHFHGIECLDVSW